MKPTRSRRNVIADIKTRLKPKRRPITVVTAQIAEAATVTLGSLPQAVMDRMEPGDRFMVVPPILGLDEWEALAAPYQDRITREAMADIDHTVAAERPEGEAPQSWSAPQVYRTS